MADWFKKDFKKDDEKEVGEVEETAASPTSVDGNSEECAEMLELLRRVLGKDADKYAGNDAELRRMVRKMLGAEVGAKYGV